MVARLRRMTKLQSTMINAFISLIAVAVLSGSLPEASMAADDLKPFPEAEAGYRRVVIRLPVDDAPDVKRVELIFGKMMKVDCNRHFLSGRLASKVVQGWGYRYFVLDDIQGPASTMMACPPDVPLKAAFVRVNFGRNDAQSGWQRYNSKLPIVIFVPDGIEVRYRIWTAEEKTVTAHPE